LEEAGLNWSETQFNLINSSCSSRHIVEAGPGTGKTETVCARIQTLVELQGIEANSILVLSFTNSAVDELRTRIKKFARNASFIPAIRITTLDRFAFSLRTGFSDGKAMKLDDYDDSMELASNLILNDFSVRDFLSSLSHVFVDEAQDITGVRTDTILNLIFRLPEDCGVTVLGDSAQAIYGFSHNDESPFPGDTLLEALRKYENAFNPSFSKVELTEIYRTSDSKLLDVFTQGRTLLISDDIPIDELYKELRGIIEDVDRESKDEDFNIDKAKALKDAFLIFRSKASALSTQALMQDHPRRLRLSGFPIPLKPWIGRVFWDSEDLISRDEFFEKYEKRCGGEVEIEENWNALLAHAGRDNNRISVSRLNTLLSSNNPPRIFQEDDVGFEGPIFSTIHRSKGREANEVVLFLPSNPSWAREMLEQIALDEYSEDDPRVEKVNEIFAKRMSERFEEARILFVGATRAKQRLHLASESNLTGSLHTFKTRRVFSRPSTKMMMSRVEIGLDLDITAEGLVSMQYFPEKQHGWSNIWENQKQFWDNRNKVIKLRARQVKSLKENSFRNFAFILENATGESEYFPLAFFDKRFDYDLMEIGRAIGKGRVKLPSEITEIYSIGATTVALSTSNEVRSKLHPEWRRSGFMLKPLIVGFPPLVFERKG